MLAGQCKPGRLALSLLVWHSLRALVLLLAILIVDQAKLSSLDTELTAKEKLLSQSMIEKRQGEHRYMFERCTLLQA